MGHCQKCHQDWLLPPNEKAYPGILQKIKIVKDNRKETGLLWKKEEPVLLHDQALALNQYQSLEQKISEKARFCSTL